MIDYLSAGSLDRRRASHLCVILCSLVPTYDRVDAVEIFLSEMNPLARIHRTSYANVPLVYVLDVELPDVGPAHMTHEVR